MIRDSSVMQRCARTHTHTRAHMHTHKHTHRHIHTQSYFPSTLCRVGVGLDAYMMPVEDGIENSVEQPLLFINTWTWQWPKNVAKIKALVDSSSNTGDSKTQLNIVM